ncbi:LysR family transcriptional regulator [Streptomyces sp. NPDC054884]|uniref:LysR family transcriptional regulator n=1 Tax=Streptomyces sp. ME08-AFT2 TaxID=3028683 RepID=UPI0039F64D35
MDIRQLRTFHRRAEPGSITRAAAELNCAQSSVTAQIQSLEVSPGGELFERFGGKVKPAPAGTRLLPYAGQTPALADEATGRRVSGRAARGRADHRRHGEHHLRPERRSSWIS